MTRRSGPAAPALAALIVAALVVAWLVVREERPAPRPVAPSSPIAAPVPVEPPERLRAPVPPPEASPSAGEAQPSADSLPLVTARLVLGVGVSTPPRWRLVVRQEDEEVAERQLAGSEAVCVLPLRPGTYSLAAEAPGLASLPARIELERAAEVALVLEPLVTLAGAVADESGAAVVGLPVHWRRGTARERGAATDMLGAFRLDALVRGAGEIVLGDLASPVVAPRALELVAGVHDAGTLVVPRLGELELQVLDEEGRPVADVEVDGTGDRGGAIAARSDAAGRARARFLPRGMYRAFARHPELGRGNTVFEFEPGAPVPVVVQLLRGHRRE